MAIKFRILLLRLKKGALHIACTLVFLLIGVSAWVQTAQIDSLRKELSTKTKVDKFNTLYLISRDFTLLNYDSSRFYGEQALQLAEEIEYQHGLYLANNLMGIVEWRDANYASARSHLREAIVFVKAEGDTMGIAAAFQNLSNLYSDMGLLDSTIHYNFKALELFEELNDLGLMAGVRNNLGSVYIDFEQWELAKEQYEIALQLYQEDPFTEGTADVENGLGMVYEELGNPDSAMYFYRKSLETRIEIDDLLGQGDSYLNIGAVFVQDSMTDSALYYGSKSLQIFQELGDELGVSVTYEIYGESYAQMGDYKTALKYLEEAKRIGDEIGAPFSSNMALYQLAISNGEMGNYKRGFLLLREYLSFRDSIFNENTSKALLSLEKKYNTVRKQQALDAKEKELAEEKADRLSERLKAEQTTSRLWYGLLGLGAILLLVGVGWIQIRRKNGELATQKNLLAKQNHALEEQKAIIQEQHTEIQQSIDYAQRIQSATLPELRIEDLFNDAFVLYKPKDIVSGDFYWLERKADYTYFAVADCTGHGIPGAFISLIGTILLNEIFNSKEIKEPHQVLDELTRLVQITLRDKNNEQLKDGMDISFCSYHHPTKTLHYAGANNPLWVVSANAQLETESTVHTWSEMVGLFLHEIKADKQPVGAIYRNVEPFTHHQVVLKEGDAIYLFSDGYADQFGGEKGKKFKYKTLKRTLLDLNGNKMNEVARQLDDTFTSWKGDLEQLDDVCVMGIRITEES